MSSVQVYETTVTDDGGNWIARIAVFPQRAFHEQQVPTSETSLRELFGFTTFQQLETASALPRVLAVLLAQDEVEQFPYPPSGAPSMRSLPPPSVVEPALFEFAEELSFTEIVPFESSPLLLQSLSSIALKAAQGSDASWRCNRLRRRWSNAAPACRCSGWHRAVRERDRLREVARSAPRRTLRKDTPSHTEATTSEALAKD